MKVIVTIEDKDGELTMEGRVENPEELDGPPTPALIIGSYLAANAERICKDAIVWATNMGQAEQASEPKTLQLVDVQGHPV